MREDIALCLKEYGDDFIPNRFVEVQQVAVQA